MASALDLRTTARQIFQRTLAAIDVEAAVREHMRLAGDQLAAGTEAFDLSLISRLVVIGLGKASIAMARAVETILGDRITDGLVVTNAVTGQAPARLRILLAGHPLPNQASVAAAEAALAMLRAADAEDTLILFLISGGGSALFEKPIDDTLTLDDLREVNRVLVGCGAVIQEMNIVRRRLSAVKGGRLAEAAPKSCQISLYISDVNSDDLSTVASGPTLPDNSTLEDFYQIVERYDLISQFPPKVAALISAGAIPETPRRSAARHSHHLLLDNRRALAAARRIAADEHGLVVEIAEDLIEGEVEWVARAHLERIETLRARHPGRTVCLLSGGEVICPVRGSGIGGRNQEFVLRAALALDRQRQENIVVLSAGTDGVDGNSPAAGAIADAATARRARQHGLSPEEYLERSDSFNLFQALGDVLLTGPTGNNVRDLRILLAR